MKKRLLILLFIAFSMNSIAQQNPPRRPFLEKRMQQDGGDKEGKKEKMELLKVQFITKELALSSEEAQQFWPVYETYKKAVQETIASKSGDEIQLQEAILSIRKKYKHDLKPILKSEDRVNTALKVDREFLNKVRFEMMRRKGLQS
jgi:hypothetical protein